MNHPQGHKANYVFAPKGAWQSGGSASKKCLEYEPFGSLLPGRNYSSDSYRFGFNGMEKDDEMHNSTGNSYDFGARMLDPRVGRWLAMDPLAAKYPSLSPYCFVGNNPITSIDPNGKEIHIMTSGGEPVKYTPGMVYSGTDTYVQNAVASLNDLYSSDGGRHLVQQASDHREVVQIIERNAIEARGAVGYYLPDDQTLHYDPELGATLVNAQGEEYGFYAPRRVLSHELRHFLNHVTDREQFANDINPKNPENAPRRIGKWSTVEERKTIQEDNAAFPNELQRTEHTGRRGMAPLPTPANGRKTTPNSSAPNGGGSDDAPGGSLPMILGSERQSSTP